MRLRRVGWTHSGSSLRQKQFYILPSDASRRVTEIDSDAPKRDRFTKTFGTGRVALERIGRKRVYDVDCRMLAIR